MGTDEMDNIPVSPAFIWQLVEKHNKALYEENGKKSIMTRLNEVEQNMERINRNSRMIIAILLTNLFMLLADLAKNHIK